MLRTLSRIILRLRYGRADATARAPRPFKPSVSSLAQPIESPVSAPPRRRGRHRSAGEPSMFRKKPVRRAPAAALRRGAGVVCVGIVVVLAGAGAPLRPARATTELTGWEVGQSGPTPTSPSPSTPTTPVSTSTLPAGPAP